MTMRTWEATPAAAGNPELVRLKERVAEAADGRDTLLESRGYEPVERQRVRLREMINSIRSILSTPDEETRLDEVLRMRPDAGRWSYGTDQRGSVVETPSDDTDRLILSGIAGYELLLADKGLRRVRIEGSFFERAILLGSLQAVAAGERAYHGEFVQYRGQEASGLVVETGIGGSMHGDFVLSRQVHFTAPVLDPIGQRREIAPGLPQEIVQGHHSIEDEILAGVLRHYASGKRDEELHTLHASIDRRLSAETYQGRGRELYADFGDRGRGIMPLVLQDRLTNQRNIEPEQVLAWLPVAPHAEAELLVVSKPEGVLFCNTVAGADEAYRSILIPDEELEDFIVTLLKNGHGRTGLDGLMSVLDAIAPKTTTP